MMIALKRSVVLAFGLVALVQVCHGASLSTNMVLIATKDSGNFNISVYPGSAAYTSGSLSNVTSGVFGDGTVLDYRFLNYADGAINLAGYAVGTGDRVLAPTNAVSANSSFSRAKVWTTTDPGADFSSTANYTASTSLRGSDVKGEVDIAGMHAGTLYVIGGSQMNLTGGNGSVSLVMSGAGQTDVSVSTGTFVNNGDIYLWVFSFEDASAYDKISYDCNMVSSTRGDFMGLILVGEITPAGTIVIVR